MFTVSCYAFHPFLQRFVRIWKYVQVVTDLITCVLSIFCCQCGDAMPLSNSSSVDTKPSVQVFKDQAVNRRLARADAERSSGEPMQAQHLVIDFPPDKDDTPRVKSQKPKSYDPIHPELIIEQNNSKFPGIHTAKKCNKKGVGRDMSLPTVVNSMVGSEESWDAVVSFCETIMSQKEAAEREREITSSHPACSRRTRRRSLPAH